MAASSHIKTQTQTQTQTQSPTPTQTQSHSAKAKRRKRRETVISTSASASSSPSPPPPSLPLHSSHIVSTDANWCCAPISAPSPPPPSHNRSAIHSQSEPDPALCDTPPTALSQSPSRSCAPPPMDPPQQPATSFPAYPTYPSSYTKFNSALNAGLLNPMSPPPLPLDKTRSSPTLFDMMSNEQEYHPRGPTTGISNLIPPPMPSAPTRAQDRQLQIGRAHV